MEDAGVIHVGAKRRRRRRLMKLWKKYRGKQRGGDRVRDPLSRSQGNSGEAEREFGMLVHRQAASVWVDDLMR